MITPWLDMKKASSKDWDFNIYNSQYDPNFQEIIENSGRSRTTYAPFIHQSAIKNNQTILPFEVYKLSWSHLCFCGSDLRNKSGDCDHVLFGLILNQWHKSWVATLKLCWSSMLPACVKPHWKMKLICSISHNSFSPLQALWFCWYWALAVASCDQVLYRYESEQTRV